MGVCVGGGSGFQFQKKGASEKSVCLPIPGRLTEAKGCGAVGPVHPGQGSFGAGSAQCSFPVTTMEMYRIQRFDTLAADRSRESSEGQGAVCNPDVIASLWAVGMGLNVRKRTFAWVQARLLEGRWENPSLA